MKAKNITHLITALLLVTCTSTFGQVTVRGTVTDKNTNKPLEGALVSAVEDSKIITTDINGNYTITVQQVPSTLHFVLAGYRSEDRKIVSVEDDRIDIQLIVTTEAGRKEESIFGLPFTIEQLDADDIKYAASSDYYDEIARFKGVYNIQASRNFNSMNARGYGPHGNVRLVQLIDGMDNVMPSLNFSLGSVTAVPELDVESIELIPGASSALYGPNAFNGIILMNTKNPFDYEGLSAQVKTGFTEDATRTEPFRDMNIRYAKHLTPSFAFKFNFSDMQGSDWVANNYNEHFDISLRDSILRQSPYFNGVNLYGDEIPVGGYDRPHRTGWEEIELLGDDYKIKSRKFDLALHYKINDNLEAVASYKYAQGTTIYQSNARYVLSDFPQRFLKFELNADKWNIRLYRTASNEGNSYNLNDLGKEVNQYLFPNNIADQGDDEFGGGWAGTRNKALEGYFDIDGIISMVGDTNAVRDFIDNGGLTSLPDSILSNLSLEDEYIYRGIPRSEAHYIIESIKKIPLNQGGAAFIDDSKLYHVEGNYDLSEYVNNQASVQIGGNWRRYSIFSNGTIFNEEVDNFEYHIPRKINEFGAYLQASDEFLNDQLKLTGSLRFDKSSGLEGQLSPRLSVVYSVGKSRKHNIRASYQTGFRNPTAQQRYLFFKAGPVFLLGGDEETAQDYGLHGVACKQSTFVPTINCDTLTSNYIEPERLTALDVGYKGVFADGKGSIDVNAYYNTYNNFIITDSYVTLDTFFNGNTPVAPLEAIFRPYYNAKSTARTSGITTSIEYTDNDWTFTGNYSSSFELKKEDREFEGSLNTPTHRINLGVRKLLKNLSFSSHLRWQSEIDWQDAYSGPVPSYYTIDAQMGYRLPVAKTTFKLGINNLTKNDYITNYGGARIGRVVYFAITYDELFGKR